MAGLCLAGVVSAAARETAAPLDVLIAGGRVLDGTGNPSFPADVGLRDGRIVAVGDLRGAAAARTVDARDLVVVPGFIDLHSHADDGNEESGLRHSDPKRRAAPNLVSQGITTVVVNPDGDSPWPIGAQREKQTALGIGPNAVLMVGHNTIRSLALKGDERRAATPGEIETMRALLRQGLAEGAWGLSSGLEYVSGRWSTTEELLALVGETARAGALYITHERSAGDPMWYYPSQHGPSAPTVLDSARENVRLAQESGGRVVITHLKARGTPYWGASGQIISLIERMRAKGLDLWADQYPYNSTGSDGRIVLIPSWALSFGGESESRGGLGPAPAARDYAAALRSVLGDPSAAAKLRADVAFEIERRGGADKLVVFDHPDSHLVGKSLAAIAGARGLSPVEVVLRLQAEGDRSRPGGARLRGFSLAEEDIEAFAARPWVATASDAGIALPEDGPEIHPRFYGTFPRKLKHYALERGALSLADAVRSATSLPARILGLCDRGLIHPGYRADVAVIDLGRITDRATFAAPHQYASGVEYVFVNGTPVVDGGTLTWTRPGTVLGREGPCRSDN